MLTSNDIFLLLASISNFNPSKSLIKRLCESSLNFIELFNGNLNSFRSKLNFEEIEKINQMKTEIKKFNLDAIKKLLDKSDTQFLAFLEKEYPKKLKEISDPPFGLFYRGNLNILNNLKSVAIVGTRAGTTYGMNISKKIASLLAKRNVVIISGLAEGIDTSAHIGALQSGKTISVLGTGLDIIFPAGNRDLYNEILAKDGLIVSEYPPKTEGLPWNFPQRNRIISGLSDAVVVIEGDLQSGALITARFAIKHGKPLFALPGPIDSPTSNGPNILIKSGVAELLTSVDDVLEKIGEGKQIKLDLKDNGKSLDELSENQKVIYKMLSSNNSRSFDAVLHETKLTTQELIKELSIMELRGYIEKITDGGYIKCMK